MEVFKYNSTRFFCYISSKTYDEVALGKKFKSGFTRFVVNFIIVIFIKYAALFF